MGIPKLQSYLRKNYPNAFKFSLNVPETYGASLGLNDIYLDGNALLYPISSTTKNPEEIGKKLLQVAQAYASSFSCKCHIYMDGPAHMGKIKQQRVRRFGYEPMITIVTTSTPVGERKGVIALPQDVHNTSNTEGISGTPLVYWSNAVFTPGTEIMERIHKYIISHITEYKGVDRYSSYHEAGEGEHKIIRDIKKISLTSNTGSASRVAIVGKDADLLLLGMSITQAEGYNVIPIIIRHNDKLPKGGGENANAHLAANENGYTPNDPFFYVDCTTLRKGIVSSFSKNDNRSIWDFIIGTYLVGNDFLPPVPELSNVYVAIPIILSALMQISSLYMPMARTNIYTELEEGYSANVPQIKGSINWNSFRVYIQSLINMVNKDTKYRAEVYAKWIQGVHLPRRKGHANTEGISSGGYTSSSARTNLSTEIPQVQTFDDLYYFNMSPFPVDRNALVFAWLTTIQWVFTYYHDGLNAASVAWQYPPYYSPSLNTINTSAVLSDEKMPLMAKALSAKKANPLTPVQALAAVLPIWLHDLLPEDIRKKIPTLKEFYPYTYQILPATNEPIIPIIPYSIVSSI